MVKKSKYQPDSHKDFHRYHADKMTEEERNAFEKNLLKDPFEEEAGEGLSGLSMVQLEEDMLELSSRLTKKTAAPRRYFAYRIAAGIAILLTVSSLFYVMVNRKISNGNGPAIITESIEKPKQENTVSEPQKEVYSKPETKSKKTARENKKEAESPVKQDIMPEAIPSGNAIAESDQAEEFSSQVPDTSVPVQKENMVAEKDMAPPVLSRAATGVSSRESPDARLEKQEENVISGRVVSADDYEPIPGVNIQVEGSNLTALTDKDGKFEIEANPQSDSIRKLKVSFIGMENEEVLADAGSNLNIVMNPSSESLDEVIVTGAGSKRKSTSAIKSKPAEPVAGQKSFDKYIASHQHFPETNPGITQAKIVLEFTVDDQGKPENIKVLENPGKEFSDEAIRLLLNGPLWLAANPPSFPTRVKIILNQEKK